MNPYDKKDILAVWEKALKRQGYRVTRPRLQVMQIIVSSEVPLTPQQIFQGTLRSANPPGIASVYRTLEMLDDLGLIQQIHQPGGCHKIWPAFDGHQHFLICKDCGHVRVIDGSDQMAGYITNIEHKTGYQVVDHWLQLFGLCEGCIK